MPPKPKFDRETVIAAGLDLVRERGTDGLTARALGQKLGSSVCPVFTVFADMDEVRAAVKEAAKGVYAEYVREGLRQTPAFKGAGMQYIAFAMREPALFRWLFMSSANVRSGLFLPTVEQNYTAILDSVRIPYCLTEEQAKELYLHMTVYSHGIAALCASGTVSFTREEVGNMLTEVFTALLKETKWGA